MQGGYFLIWNQNVLRNIEQLENNRELNLVKLLFGPLLAPPYFCSILV